MDLKYQLYIILLAICLLLTPLLRAQDDNPLNDPDMKEMLKQAQEMQKEAKELQKQNPTLARRKEEALRNAITGERRGSADRRSRKNVKRKNCRRR